MNYKKQKGLLDEAIRAGVVSVAGMAAWLRVHKEFEERGTVWLVS